MMDGDALARLRGGEMGGGAGCGLESTNIPPRIGSYRCPELAGLGVEGATLMCERFGLLCRGSGLLNTRGACVTGGGCSGWSTGASSAGLVCGAGCCCTAGFSSTGAGGVLCASSDAFVLLLRGAGADDGSLGSAGLRGFLGFFSSTTFGSLGFGFGPGFLRTVPAAVSLGVVVDDAGVGVLAFAATPTPLLPTRIVVLFGVPCSGE